MPKIYICEFPRLKNNLKNYPPEGSRKIYQDFSRFIIDLESNSIENIQEVMKAGRKILDKDKLE